MYKMWLDDERQAPPGFIWVRSVGEAKKKILTYGIPYHINLDHDLGLGCNNETETVMDFLKWLADNYSHEPPTTYTIHTSNPVGRENIRSFMNSWYRSLQKQKGDEK